MFKVAVAFDHGGFSLRERVLDQLQKAGCEILDQGAYEYDAEDDYPDFAVKAARAVQDGQADRAIIVCGSGVGACIAANKLPGVRAGICHDTYSARQGVNHDDMNVLCLGGRIIGEELVSELIDAFLSASFSDGEKYTRRLNKIAAIEKEVVERGEVPSPS
jgi:ribose 5-phosphate isomerase B